MNEAFTLSIGVDCGSEFHQVCVLNTSQRLVGERRVEHTGADVQALADWLLTLGETDPSRILVAIEVPRGAIVETLLECGFRVWASTRSSWIGFGSEAPPRARKMTSAMRGSWPARFKRIGMRFER